MQQGGWVGGRGGVAGRLPPWRVGLSSPPPPALHHSPRPLSPQDAGGASHTAEAEVWAKLPHTWQGVGGGPKYELLAFKTV